MPLKYGSGTTGGTGRNASIVVERSEKMSVLDSLALSPRYLLTLRSRRAPSASLFYGVVISLGKK
jgi:hypothetical protein